MISQKAIELIKHYESLHDGDLSKIGLQPKACPTGFWTVGYGRVIIDPVTGKMLKGSASKARAFELYPVLSEVQACSMLINDILKYELAVRSAIRSAANENQVGACVSLCYNIGIGNFTKPSSVLRNLNNKKLQESADAFMLWVKGNVDADPELEVLPGLVARRKSERDLFLYGTLKFYN